MIAVRNILKGNRKHPDYRGTPSVAFTVPSLVRTGLLEEEARAGGYDVEVRAGDMSGWYTLRRTNESHGAYKVIIDKTSGTILGAHLLGGYAGETIIIFATVIRNLANPGTGGFRRIRWRGCDSLSTARSSAFRSTRFGSFLSCV